MSKQQTASVPFYIYLKNTFLITVGAVSAGMGIKGFLLSSRFIDGGVTGISMLLNDIFGTPIYVFLIVINFPFIILGYRHIGWQFAVKSIVAIIGLSCCLAFIPYPDVTPDKLLTAVFGGFFLGTGIGLAMRGGAVLDGTEIAALLLSKRSAILKVSDIILLMNVLIFSCAAFFLSVESALYSILTYFAASKMIDFVLNGIEEYTAVTIISPQNEHIKRMIIEDLGRGVTIYQAKGGYGTHGEQDTTTDIVYTVVTRLEVGNLQSKVNRLDPNAFMIYQSVNDIKGGIVKKRSLH